MIVVLAGGVGGSRFVDGLVRVVPPERVTVIANTGDDDEFHGLYVSPDPDIITYALAGEVDEARGWGYRGDTFRWLESIRRFGHETWFRIGDRDLATHLHRTRLLREGRTLAEATADIARAFGVRARILPMSNDRVRTRVVTDGGVLSFQEYLVRDRAAPAVTGVRFEGAEAAKPAPGVLEVIARAEAILIAPSNPIGSIGPILAIPGVRRAIADAKAPVAAVSPIIAGRQLQPPALEMMRGLRLEPTAAGVAFLYADLLQVFVMDEQDSDLVPKVEGMKIRPVLTDTLMASPAKRAALAATVLDAAAVKY